MPSGYMWLLQFTIVLIKCCIYKRFLLNRDWASVPKSTQPLATIHLWRKWFGGPFHGFFLLFRKGKCALWIQWGYENNEASFGRKCAHINWLWICWVGCWNTCPTFLIPWNIIRINQNAEWKETQMLLWNYFQISRMFSCIITRRFMLLIQTDPFHMATFVVSCCLLLHPGLQFRELQTLRCVGRCEQTRWIQGQALVQSQVSFPRQAVLELQVFQFLS